ncbi:unnamed protein product [Symbiodinium necroappetens]|uniref:Pentatricopeptide repeat-containing protein, chloroplastic n=1 Tax=Symbiodinium necroappetens TaxID=1628268 RepID=A0A813CCT3_9DINO|nr:unnamed protein product [Symbiodinium necroappetens]
MSPAVQVPALWETDFSQTGASRKELSAVIERTRDIASLARGSQWRDAMTLLADMPSCVLRPNVISYNSTLAACARSEQWQLASSLLRGVRAHSILPNVITYNTAIRSSVGVGFWQLVSGGRHG